MQGRLGLLVGLFLLSLALRPQVVAIGPLLPRIQHDLHLSHALAGLLATIPVICMGLVAPPSAYLLQRLSSRAAIAISVAAIGVGGVVRALVPGFGGVLALTLPLGIGAGVAGALLPVAVKERFADRPALGTGVYASGLSVGAAVAAALAVPVADLVGGWRESLVAMSVLTVALVPLALRLWPPDGAATVAARPRLPLRSGIAWMLVLAFGPQSLVFYGVNSWLADAFVERGWSEASAGGLTAAFSAASLAGTLAISLRADRGRARRPVLLAAAGAMVVCLAALILAPAGAWAWTSLAGFASGALFALTLTLPLDAARRPADAGALAGMMLGVGYVISGLGPFSLGAVRDVAGSFTAVLWTLVALIALNMVACAFLSQERLQRGRAGAPSLT